ncbi:hypothetical protein HYC85_023004 [Camellia sinensis]|uniref:Uncharacterized protein n=1 Tax=Camellia sinensis TaxID=4442 RepID=A0A7J7GEH4_CAMSI|nr:hypothetical protein HYC85_023004 [Camellia sinensis]
MYQSHNIYKVTVKFDSVTKQIQNHIERKKKKKTLNPSKICSDSERSDITEQLEIYEHKLHQI